MSDVTAVVLSIGEAYTERAIASVQRQTYPAAEIIVVQGISPFFRAMNTAAARVRTEFFIQVDSDMILDPTCVADLRCSVAAQSGLVVGQLRDPLRGNVIGVKLFRTCSFDRAQYRDRVCQDTEFHDELLREAGWTRAYALRYVGEARGAWHTFGQHVPDYSPHYTFCKFLIEGARARHRKGEGKFHSLFRQLRAGTERAATIAVIAVAHGLFLKEERDLLIPFGPNPEADFVDGFVGDRWQTGTPAAGEDIIVDGNLTEAFKRAYEHGIRLRRMDAAAEFFSTLNRLHRQGTLAASVALVGLGHALFVEQYREADADDAFASLRELLPINGSEPVNGGGQTTADRLQLKGEEI